MNKKYLIFLMLLILILILPICSNGGSINTKKDYSINSLSGTIFINVLKPNSGHYINMKGLSIIFPDALMKQVYEEEVEIIQGDYENKIIPSNSNYNTFLKTAEKEREYWNFMKDKIEQVFFTYDIKLLNDIYHTYEIKCHPHTKKWQYEQRYPKQFSPNYFIPNRQLLYSLYEPFSLGGILINTRTKEISYPFGCDSIGMFEWSPNGQFIAYSYDDEKTLVIVNVINDKTVLRKIICKGNRGISDITWEPNSGHVAVLTVSRRIGLLMPWRYLEYFVAGGNPSFNSYYLDIFNLDGENVYSKNIVKGIEQADADIVWVADDITIINQ